MPLDGKQRFSNRVTDHVKYRPGYPAELLELLVAETGLSQASVVADAGSGTGILSALLLDSGCQVAGVEPNREMREAAETLIGDRVGFWSIDGSAEDTTLAAASVDLVTAGQAFHWFDEKLARKEFKRILKPGGHVVLVWNQRKTDCGAFSEAYDALLHAHACDYAQVDHRNVDDARIRAFFAPAEYQSAQFANRQHLDWEGLYGRALSSSYVPAQDHPQHAQFAEALRALFEEYAEKGHVDFEYDTLVYYGQLAD